MAWFTVMGLPHVHQPTLHKNPGGVSGFCKDAMCIVLNNGDLMTMEGMTQTLGKISRDAS